MNNNKTDEAALLNRSKGVFAKTSYITVGTKEQPEPYGVKDKLRSNYVGKQFVASQTREGRTPETYFEKKHIWIFDGDKFVDRTKYTEIQKEKQKGFLTGDFRRRDEFSNTIRTEQWREQLKQEKKFANLTIQSPSPDKETGEDHQLEASPVQEYLYDRVFEKPDLEFNGASHTRRDTSNPTLLSTLRNVGGMKTTYNLSHPAPVDFEKPEYARKPVIRDTFYRRMNVPLAER